MKVISECLRAEVNKIRLFRSLITAFFSIKNHANFYYRELLLLKKYERSEFIVAFDFAFALRVLGRIPNKSRNIEMWLHFVYTNRLAYFILIVFFLKLD